MPEEEDALLDAGGQTVQVNGDNGLIFIDSYPRDSKGNLIVGISKPRCPYLDSNKKCSVHSVRPLTCHLYPLGIETQLDGRIVWALHTDCAHVRTMKESGYQELLLCNLKQLLQRISSSLKEEIRIVYEKTDSIAVFPNGSNNYLVLEEI
jgi:Fe-S-cluster containining protein